MNISIPKTVRDCTPDQLSKWLLISQDANLEGLIQKLEFRVQVVSIFSGITKDELRQGDYRDINMIFAECIQMLSEYEQSEPSGVVEADGVKYIFEKDIFAFNTGQAIDMKLIDDVYSNPYEVMAILYVEEGMQYNQLNEKKVVMNPNNKRVKVFKEHFPGDEFLNVFGFFLNSYHELNNAMSILKMAQTEVMMTNQMKELKKEVKELNKMNGTSGHRIFSFWRKS